MRYAPESPPMNIDRVLSEWLSRELLKISYTIPDIVFSSIVPASGQHNMGEIVFNDGTITTIATVDHWRCTVSGIPGTWIAKA